MTLLVIGGTHAADLPIGVEHVRGVSVAALGKAGIPVEQERALLAMH
jgi:hypothetical protein